MSIDLNQLMHTNEQVSACIREFASKATADDLHAMAMGAFIMGSRNGYQSDAGMIALLAAMKLLELVEKKLMENQT